MWNTELVHVCNNQGIFDVATPVVIMLFVFIQNCGIYSGKH